MSENSDAIRSAYDGFNNGDPEVLLVGWQNEGFAGSEGAPFRVAEQQAGPMDAFGAARIAGKCFEALAPVGWIWAGHH